MERWGRRMLVRLVSMLLGRRPRPVLLPAQPRILVLRFDARLGNVVLLTPVLQTLRAQCPDSHIDVLGNKRSARLLASHPAVNGFAAYDKAAFWRAEGPLGTWWRLRRSGYDLCLDLSNPTDPSVTHALVARLCGAKATIGSDGSGFGRLFTAPVDVSQAGPHEIDLRLALLAPLGKNTWVRQPTLGALPVPSDAPVVSFVQQTLTQPYAVLNLGARLAQKRLKAADYAVIAYALMAAGLRPVLTYGPDEAGLAQQVIGLMPDAIMAPPTDVAELALVMRGALCVISCDTGPMHLAVALGRPTCGLFVNTSLARFGYSQTPHACVQVAGRPPEVWMPCVRGFVTKLVAPGAQARAQCGA
jgi:ADP-heptose:LPS heptosyltransferase